MVVTSKRKITGRKSNWKTWTLVVEEGRKLNRQVTRESDKLIKRTDSLIKSITKTKVA